MRITSYLRLFNRWLRPTWSGNKTLLLFLVPTIVMYTLYSDMVIAHVDVIAQKQTRAMVYPTNNINLVNNDMNLDFKADAERLKTTKKEDNGKLDLDSSIPLEHFQTNSTLLDNSALLQASATDSSRPPLVRSLASLQLALDAYVDGIEFRVESEGDGVKIRFSSLSKGRVSATHLDVRESGWDPCVKDDSVLVSGTSFTREIYFAMLRRLKHEALGPEDKMIPSYDTTLDFEENCTRLGHAFKGTQLDGRRWCIYGGKGTKGCNLPGPAGLFIEKCGMPKSQVRSFKDVNMTVSFRFKTYLYTPVVDESILRAIRSENNGLVVLGGGEWGRTPEKHFRYLSSPDLAPIEHLDQARQYIGSVLEAMIVDSSRKPPLLVIYCNKGFNRSCRAFCEAGLEAQDSFLRGRIKIPVLVIHISRFEKQYNRLRRRDRARVPRLGHGHQDEG